MPSLDPLPATCDPEVTEEDCCLIGHVSEHCVAPRVLVFLLAPTGFSRCLSVSELFGSSFVLPRLCVSGDPGQECALPGTT